MEGELLPTESNMSGLVVPMPTLPRKVVQRVRVRGVEAIREIAVASEVTYSVQSQHGWKYVVDGVLLAAGVKAELRTVWIVDVGSQVARLVTAYPKS